MDENTKLWNKKMDELTVTDAVLLNAVLPIIVIGGMVAAGPVVGGVGSAVNRFRTRKTVKTETN